MILTEQTNLTAFGQCVGLRPEEAKHLLWLLLDHGYEGTDHDDIPADFFDHWRSWAENYAEQRHDDYYEINQP